jgi:hypothetical protein
MKTYTATCAVCGTDWSCESNDDVGDPGPTSPRTQAPTEETPGPVLIWATGRLEPYSLHRNPRMVPGHIVNPHRSLLLAAECLDYLASFP